jgi:hypothetical protein
MTLRTPETIKNNLDWNRARLDTHRFHIYYGSDGTGDLYTNVDGFIEYARMSTPKLELVMADGGFELDGQEHRQEFLSSRLLLVQIYAALSLLTSKDGRFVCKVFNTVTTMSEQLIWLCSLCFEDVWMFKPMSSRPANAERYMVCKKFRGPEVAAPIVALLKEANSKYPQTPVGSVPSSMVSRLIRSEIIPAEFRAWLHLNNDISIQRQINYSTAILDALQGRPLHTIKYDLHKASIIWSLPDNQSDKRSMINRSSFPFTKNFLDPAEVMFGRLQDLAVSQITSTERYSLAGVPVGTASTFQGGYLRFISTPELYHSIDAITDHWNEDLRLSVGHPGKVPLLEWWRSPYNREGVRMSITGAVANPSKLWRLQGSRKGLSTRGKMTPREIREKIYQLGDIIPEAQHVRPTWLKGMLSHFKPTKVLDMTTRWGDLLITCIATHTEYLGFEPNKELQHSHDQMVFLFGDSERQKVRQESFWLADSATESLRFDLVFGSFNPHDERSMQDVVIRSVEKGWISLRQGGKLAIHLVNIGKSRYVEDLITKMNQLGGKFLGTIGFSIKLDHTEPLWVWERL